MINPDLITTVRVDQLPPDSILLTDIFPFETLADETLKKATFQQLIDFININANALQYEIKSLFVNQEYIDNNIDETGLGINLLVGWRLFTEIDNKIELGYGAVRNNIGSYVGLNEHTLSKNQIPPIDVSLPVSGSENSGGTHIYVNATDLQPEGTKVYSNAAGNKGAVQSISLMQSSLVVLKIIKL